MQPEKKSNTVTYVVLAIVIIAVIFGIVMSTSDKNKSPESSTTATEMSSEKENSLKEDGATNTNTDTDDSETTMDTSTSAEAGTYNTYSKTKVANSQADNIILFFHATWCPSCRALNTDIEENLANIPADTEIYKVDYDTATEMRKQYGITTQHTLVLVNSDGTMIKKWSGSPTLDRVISSI